MQIKKEKNKKKEEIEKTKKKEELENTNTEARGKQRQTPPSGQ